MASKFISLVRSRSGDSLALRRWLLEEFAPQLARAGLPCAVNVVGEPSANLAHVVLETWAADPADVARIHTSKVLEQAHLVTYLVREWIEKDELGAAGSPTSAIKLIAAWEAREDVARTDVRRHWDEHVPLANAIHIGCVRYVRNWVDGLAASSEYYPRSYQGFACQYFRSHQELVERSFDRPENRAVIEADVADFLTRFDVLLTTEYLFH
jgi:hypothetical protein